MYTVSILICLLLIFGFYKLWGTLSIQIIVLGFAGFFYSIFAISALSSPDRSAGQKLLIRTLGKGGIALSAIMIVVPFTAFAVGFGSALYQQDFVVTATEPQRIVLATYGSQAVCTTLNSDQYGPYVSKNFSVIDLSSDRLEGLSKKHIGKVFVRDR